MNKKNYDVARKIHKGISKFGIRIHSTVVLFKELYTEPIWKSLVSEGFSIKEDKFLREVIDIKPVEIFSYNIKKMNPSEKTQFNRKFNEVMKSTNSFRIGAGSVVVPEEKTGRFNDFFDHWSNKADKKVFRALLL